MLLSRSIHGCELQQRLKLMQVDQDAIVAEFQQQLQGPQKYGQRCCLTWP